MRDSAIIYNKNTMEYIEGGTFWMSKTPEVPKTKFKESSLIRSCTWGFFNQKKLDKKMYVFNTHLDHESEPGRKL